MSCWKAMTSSAFFGRPRDMRIPTRLRNSSRSRVRFSLALGTLVDLVHAGTFSNVLLFGLLTDLQRRHVFDAGNQRALDWIEAQRRSVVSAVDPYSGAYGLRQPVSTSVPSEESLEVQAADVAAGIAKRLLESRVCYRALLNVFPWVVYNGVRLSSYQAERIGRITSPGVQIVLRKVH